MRCLIPHLLDSERHGFLNKEGTEVRHLLHLSSHNTGGIPVYIFFICFNP